jgi:phosphatidylglycerophosphatase A
VELTSVRSFSDRYYLRESAAQPAFCSNASRRFSRELFALTETERSVSLKESSDELNPSVKVPEVVGRTPARGPVDYLALAIATFGVGLLPLAPGTWGSLVGVGIYLLIRALTLDISLLAFNGVLVVAILVITISGIWAASQTERLTGRKDPGKVVVDEVSGQLISLLPITVVPVSSWKVWVIVSFILFRFFDIVKPYPARRMERLHGGLGIMCDDLIAGIYAAAVILIAMAVMKFF